MSEQVTTADQRSGPGRGRVHDHVVPVSTYVAVFVALMVLTLATVGASRVDLGAFNTPVALAIAVSKAILVVLFFMHVKWSPRIVALFLAGALFWLFHMIAGTTADYISRSDVDPRPDRPIGGREPGS
jgi:cytochrome c oxidase subunit 4